MPVFIDTSALLPIVAAQDRRHSDARNAWEALLAAGDDLTCSSYVLLETIALVQNRLGMEAVRALQADVYPALRIQWVDADLHEAGMSLLLAQNRRQLSLVDCVSFEVMRRRGIRRVFAFDTHFEEQGFEAVPSIA